MRRSKRLIPVSQHGGGNKGCEEKGGLSCWPRLTKALSHVKYSDHLRYAGSDDQDLRTMATTVAFYYVIRKTRQRSAYLHLPGSITKTLLTASMSAIILIAQKREGEDTRYGANSDS
jgi:hypothetical protein